MERILERPDGEAQSQGSSNLWQVRPRDESVGMSQTRFYPGWMLISSESWKKNWLQLKREK